jgi:arabinofuranan 3-O-arabinosyltransferase
VESRVGPAQEVTPVDGDRRWKVRRATTCMAFLVICVLQAPGRLVGDTKADLTIDPLGFMGRAFHMWDPSGFAGQVQNQAYGYLLPMGPFFAAFDVLHVPEWVAQRLWWAALLSIAFLGAHRLFVALDLGTNWSRYVGALSYALAPRILGVMGAASVEGYPAALTPWVLVPLVMVASGRTKGLARAAALSALAVGLMGGVNAAVNLAAVLPAVLWFLTRRWDRTVAKLAGWWALFVAMATLWWVVPLLLLGRYSPDFLDYIESAGDTTKVTNLIETVRGTSHWVGFLSNGLGSIWQIGGDLVTDSALIANTIVVAAAGLVGIVLLRITERLWVVTCLLVGVAMVTFGHLNAVEGWFAVSQHSALDGALAPLRNVHKFDVLIRLALSIGVVSVLSRLDIRKAWAQRNFGVVLWPAVITLAVIGVAAPAFIGRLAPTGAYAAVPDYWSQTGTWLDQHPDGRALVAPGSRFGRYIWGTTNDEILQALTSSDWEVRNAIPLTPAGHIRMLDAIERRFATGQASEGLADYLTRNGIGYVVVRHDLSGAEAHARTGFVEHVLSTSPGFAVVKRIGPVINPNSITTTLNDSNLSPPRHAIEIWKVGTGAPDRLSLTSASAASEVSGDSSSLLDLADAGALPAGATVMSGDQKSGARRPSGTAILTDDYRRREVNYGRIGNNQSATLTPYDPLTLARAHPDYAPYSVVAHGSLGQWVGALSVVASSSLANAASIQPIRSDESVRAMFDGDPDTYWSAAPETAGTTQRVTIKPDNVSNIGRITIQFRPGVGSELNAISAIADDAKPVAAAPDPSDPDKWVLDLTTSVSHQLVLSFSEARGSFTPVQVSNLDLAGMPISYRIALPHDLVGGPDVIVASSTPGYNDGCLSITGVSTRCSPGIVRGGEDDAGVDRSFALDRGGRFVISASAAMRPGAALDRLQRSVADAQVTARVSSSAVDQPAANAAALLDDDLGTTWVAADADRRPHVTVTLDRRRTVSRFRFHYDKDMPASRPGSVVVKIAGKSFRRLVAPDGTFGIPATSASSFELEFTGDERTANFDPATGSTDRISIGISELTMSGVPRNVPPAPRTVRYPCGKGPVVRVDGKTYETSVAASSGDLLAGSAVAVTPCDSAPTLTAGEHTFSLLSDTAWRPVRTSLTRDGMPTVTAGSQALTPTTWTRDRRTVTVPERAEDSFLAVDENINAGWRATFGGKTLKPVTVDGWKQGFVVPKGAAGLLTMTFAPSRTFTWSLGVGFALLLALLVTIGILVRRRTGAAVAIRAAQSPVFHSVMLIAALGVIGGTAGAGAAVIAVAVSQVARRSDRGQALLIGLGILLVSFTAAGIMLVLRPAGGTHVYFGEKPLSQLLVLVALAMAAAPWPTQRWNRLSGTSSTR